MFKLYAHIDTSNAMLCLGPAYVQNVCAKKTFIVVYENKRARLNITVAK